MACGWIVSFFIQEFVTLHNVLCEMLVGFMHIKDISLDVLVFTGACGRKFRSLNPNVYFVYI